MPLLNPRRECGAGRASLPFGWESPGHVLPLGGGRAGVGGSRDAVYLALGWAPQRVPQRSQRAPRNGPRPTASGSRAGTLHSSPSSPHRLPGVGPGLGARLLLAKSRQSGGETLRQTRKQIVLDTPPRTGDAR